MTNPGAPTTPAPAMLIDATAITQNTPRDPAACLHAGCHAGRCVYGPDHGAPALIRLPAVDPIATCYAGCRGICDCPTYLAR